MSRLRQLADDYLVLRRSLGFKLKDDGRKLLDFVSFLRQEGSPFITTQLAVTWATRPSGVSPNTAARRLALVRTFAKFAIAHDPRTHVPPRECLPYRARRALPYVYSTEDIRALLTATLESRIPSFWHTTSHTLFGLLAATGMRVGEAVGLDRGDFDPREGILTIRSGKFGKSREVPLHPTTHEVLRVYERKRDKTHPRPKSPAFFLNNAGNRPPRQNVSMTFSIALRKAGLSDRKPRRPRIHDLRHTFAVHTLCDWYRAGRDVEAQLPLLSTYLGHVNPSATYWYLTATPELVGLAARRLERAMGRLP
jgi:integrase/recombinase XerD